MGVLSEIYSGDRIINQYKSSNIKGSIYNKTTKKLIVEFNAGRRYEYEEIPSTVAAGLRISKSQGSYFNKEIAKKYKYKLLP
tara:strand:+ start:2542 stop:2787 length:246 start_codon:yes stop_codon:yes gene_type:complete